MSEEEVIKRRLLFDGDGTGEDRRLNVLLKMISKWVNTNEETEQECLATYDKILAQLALVQHSLQRSSLVHQQIAYQLEKYENLQSDMEQKIEMKKTEIEKQKDALEKAKVIKQNRIQYDLVAKAITKEPPRNLTNERLQVLQRDLKNLAAQKQELDFKWETRKKQFNVLTNAAKSLSVSLENDFSEGSEIRDDTDTSFDVLPEPMSE